MSHDGEQFNAGGDLGITVNSTDNPAVPSGGYYVSIGDGQSHSTAVYNPDGSLADVKANNDWGDVSTQS